MTATTGSVALRPTVTRGRWRWEELAFWVAMVAAFFLFPTHYPLLTQILISGLFAMSLDLLLGYAGIASLGHAVFFGLGAYSAGVLAQHGLGDPTLGLLAGALIAALAGFIASLLLARVQGIALLMVTLGIGLLFVELANRLKSVTGGDDGMQGVEIGPVLGLFRFDFTGQTAFLYALAVTFVIYVIARTLVRSSFGLSIEAIRENGRRAAAIGIPVRRRLRTCWTVSAALAGISGALFAECTQYIALEVLSFDRSIGALIMTVLGGIGTLLGGFVGAAFYTVARDNLSEINPTYWNFWLGLFLFLIVSLGRGGLLGGLRRLQALGSRR